jgi:NAD(P)-dependent dehydrogenase (short-subunit alcohol dehydrogenase family)
LVLGASSGLGADVASRLAGLMSTLFVHGATVAEVARLRAEVAERERSCRVVPVSADFASFRDTREMMRRCAVASDGLDMIVNAVERLPPQSFVVTEDGNELTWQVNYLAPALVVLGLAPLLRDSPDGRIVQVVRDQHRIGVPRADDAERRERYQPVSAYTDAKLALLTLSRALAGRLRGTSCRSISMQPAGVDTGLAPAPLSRGLMVDAVLYACTSPGVPNGAYLRGRWSHPLPRAAGGAAGQRRLWRATCDALRLDVRTGRPMRRDDPVRGVLTQGR